MLLFKQFWTSFVSFRKNHPYYPSVQYNICKQDKQTVNQKIEKLKKITDLHGFTDAFKIFTDHYNNKTNFLELPFVSPQVALQVNHYNSDKHHIRIVDISTHIEDIQFVSQKVISMDNPVFGMCNKSIGYELCCGMVGPESADNIMKPPSIVVDVHYKTTEIHTIDNNMFTLNNNHVWRYNTDLEIINWNVNEILSLYKDEIN